MDVVFRDAPEQAVSTPIEEVPEPEKDNTRVASGESDKEPIEFREEGGGSVVLDALGINDKVDNLPEQDKENLQEVKNYVKEIIKAKGLPETVGAFKKSLDGLKGEMGLDEEAEPSIVLDRIAGVIKAWRNLSFVKDSSEKKRIFFKLANLKSSEEMNRMVYDLMNKYEIWR